MANRTKVDFTDKELEDIFDDESDYEEKGVKYMSKETFTNSLRRLLNIHPLKNPEGFIEGAVYKYNNMPYYGRLEFSTYNEYNNLYTFKSLDNYSDCDTWDFTGFDGLKSEFYEI